MDNQLTRRKLGIGKLAILSLVWLSYLIKKWYLFSLFWRQLWNCIVIFSGNECCERLAYYGMSTNLVNYFIERMHQGNATAAKNVNNWSGTCYIMPLLGAFLADAYLGRYWVIAIFSMIYVIVSLLHFSNLFFFDICDCLNVLCAMALMFHWVGGNELW